MKIIASDQTIVAVVQRLLGFMSRNATETRKQGEGKKRDNVSIIQLDVAKRGDEQHCGSSGDQQHVRRRPLHQVRACFSKITARRAG